MSNLSELDASPINDEIDLKELFLVLWEGKYLIGLVTSIAAMVSVVIALMLPNIYHSVSVLVPKSGDSGSGQLARSYGGIAALAGVALPSGGSGDAQLAKQAISSVTFVENYLMDEILVELMAVEAWHTSTDTLEIDPDLYNVKLGMWVRDVPFPFSPRPHIDEAMIAYRSQVQISEDKETGALTLTVKHLSPSVAQKWNRLIIKGVNDFLRTRKISDADAAIAYLTEQRATSQLVKMDDIFSGLIEEQTKEKMLASVHENYLFDVIQSPTRPIFKSGPERALICVLGTLLGGMLAVVLCLLDHYLYDTQTSRKIASRADQLRENLMVQIRKAKDSAISRKIASRADQTRKNLMVQIRKAKDSAVSAPPDP